MKEKAASMSAKASRGLAIFLMLIASFRIENIMVTRVHFRRFMYFEVQGKPRCV